MVRRTDGLGRPIYVVDTQDNDKRLHPYTYEPVSSNYEYEYPNVDMTLTWTIAIMFASIVIGLIIYSVIF